MLMQSMSIVPVVGSVADCCMATCMQSYELLNFCHAFHYSASFAASVCMGLPAFCAAHYDAEATTSKLNATLHLQKLLDVQGKSMYSEQSPMYAPGSSCAICTEATFIRRTASATS